MEVSTVSPPPTSPTEGDDLCEIDVTDVAIDSVMLLICLCWLVGNGAVLCLRGFSTHSKPITVYIFNVAITDSTFLLIILTGTLFLLQRYRSCSFIRDVPWHYQALLFQLLLFSYNLGLFLLTAISFNRCRSTLCPLWCHCHHAQHQSKVVSAMLWATSIALIPALTSLFNIERQQEENFYEILVFMYVVNLLLFASSTIISSTHLFIKVKRGCQQQPLERLDIVIFLMVLLTLPSGICNVLLLFHDNIYSAVLPLLMSIPSSIKPFIYFSVARCWRHRSVGSLRLSLQRLLGEPEETTAHSNDDTTDTAV